METQISHEIKPAITKEPIRVLIVEDESIIALEMESRLIAMEYEVVECVASGEEDLEIVNSTAPDVILMDINIHGKLDGVMLAKTIREHYAIPCIFLTAYSDNLTIKRAAGSNPLGYLTKPFSDREVHAAIQIGLYREEKERELKAQRDELARVNQELQSALKNIQVLQGLLPMCAWCKSIRLDDGYWQEVSAYLVSHTAAEVTHSICPDCADKKFK
jgi:CheY-like chemotaxis protein